MDLFNRALLVSEAELVVRNDFALYKDLFEPTSTVFSNILDNKLIDL